MDASVTGEAMCAGLPQLALMTIAGRMVATTILRLFGIKARRIGVAPAEDLVISVW